VVIVGRASEKARGIEKKESSLSMSEGDKMGMIARKKEEDEEKKRKGKKRRDKGREGGTRSGKNPPSKKRKGSQTIFSEVSGKRKEASKA